MSGSHHDDHHHHRPIAPTMPGSVFPTRSRRAFLGDFGRGTLAIAVFTPLVAACSSGDDSEAGASSATAIAEQPTSSDQPTGSADETSDTQDTVAAEGQEEVDGALRWGRANLGFVSAYVLARGNAAAIVDTGTSGSAAAIGETLQGMGLTYADVDHVILTHHHGDHTGSINEVLAEAESATVYAGQADLENINIDTSAGFDPEKIVALVGGEDVFGFETIATPGHTRGHMAAIDRTAGLLVAGDAIFTDDGQAIEGPARFFSDVDRSRETIAQLAALSFNTLLIGHGDPIESGADASVAALATSLP